jgi:hypothetical protein
MLRLTLCSGRNGKFLARIVDQDGYPFVLDFGDRRLIDDIAQRLARGFTRMKFEKLLNVQPSDKDMLLQLADYYASKGYLVVLDEPNWAGRDHALPQDPYVEEFHAPSSSEVSPLEEEDSLADFSFDHLPDFTEDMPTEFAIGWNATVEDGETEFIVREDILETEETEFAMGDEAESED